MEMSNWDIIAIVLAVVYLVTVIEKINLKIRRLTGEVEDLRYEVQSNKHEVEETLESCVKHVDHSEEYYE